MEVKLDKAFSNRIEFAEINVSKGQMFDSTVSLTEKITKQPQLEIWNECFSFCKLLFIKTKNKKTFITKSNLLLIFPVQ